MAYEFGGSQFRTASEMHDSLAKQFIGADRKPTLEATEEVLHGFEHEAAEMETQWGLTSGDSALEGYDREEFREAVQRLRDDLAAEQDDEDEDEAA